MESKRKDYVGNVAVLKVTLNGVVELVAASATIQLTGAQAGDTVTVNGLTYTGVAGAKANNTEFSIDTSDTAAATDLAASISNDTRTGTYGDLSAISSTDTVTATQTVAGAYGNNTTLAESTSGVRITISGATFSGGSDASTITINGLTYTGVTGAKADNTEFSVDTSDATAAADLANSIDNDVRVGTYPLALTTSVTGAVITVSATGSNVVLAEASVNNATIVIAGFTLLSLTSNVDPNNETLKRVNNQNAPFSVQASGSDKLKSGETSTRLKSVATEAQFNTITTRDRWLRGNVEGYVHAITASTSLQLGYLDKTNTEVLETLTMAQVLASNNLYFLNEKI